MKKLIIFIITCILICLSGCRNNKDQSYNIVYELGNQAEIFTETPQNAYSGEQVEIKTEIMYDADIHVYVDGEEIKKAGSEGDYWVYAFTMPDKNVTVTAKPYTKAEIWGISS